MTPVDYLSSIVVPLVSYKDKVSITQNSDQLGLLLSISLHKDDTGKIIGRGGETARAIRRVLRQFGDVNQIQERISLKILQPEM